MWMEVMFLFHDRVFKKVAVFFLLLLFFPFPKLGWNCNDQSDFQKPEVEGGNASISLDSGKIMWHRIACDLKTIIWTIMWQGTKPWYFCLQSLRVYNHFSYLPNKLVLWCQTNYFAHVPQLPHLKMSIVLNEWMNEWYINFCRF